MKTKDFLVVAKPGIVGGNVAAAVGAFLVGSPDEVRWSALIGLALGATCIIAASCVINNYMDRDIDRAMTRTRKRPSVTGVLPLSVAKPYVAFLYALGFSLLVLLTNTPTVVVGIFGSLMYTMVYGWAKRRTVYGTFVGAFSGAAPPLAGYLAAVGQFDIAAWLIFIIMFAWQMPHFYAISIFRLEDYKVANIPVMPAVRGLARTVWEMRVYAVVFIVSCYLLARSGGAGFMFGVATVSTGLFWLWPMFSPNWRSQTESLARQIYKRSLLVLAVLCSFMALSHVLL